MLVEPEFEPTCSLLLGLDVPDICTVCNTYFKHRRYNFKPYGQSLCEVKFITTHARCKTIKNNLVNCKRKLMDAEFDYFLLLLGKQG